MRGIVPDQGRAEDIVQETFISALRSLRSSDRTIAFRPWIYQIARNACIDQLRRQKRAQEVSIDSEDFNPQDEGRISQAGPSTHGAVSQREDMDALQQAFGGLPPSQHEALVLRELEGLSYAEIASRMNLSPAAVESMLFRARRGLKDEYDEIATGERCRRMQPLIAALAEGLGGARDRHALARHVRFCVTCRREATAMGLGVFVTEALRRGRMKRALHRAASLFPIPPFLLRRRGGGATADASMLDRVGARFQAPLSQLGVAGGPAAENAAGALPKAVAVVAAAALIGGGGFVGQKSDGASASAATGGGNAAAVSSQGDRGNHPQPSSAAGAVWSWLHGPAVRDTVPRSTGAAGGGGLGGLGSPALPGGGGLGFGGGGQGGQSGLADPSSAAACSVEVAGARLAVRPSLGGSLGDTVDRVVPQSVGGVSLPAIGGGGSSPGTGVGDTVGKVVDKVRASQACPRSSLPSRSPSSSQPAKPSVPKVTVPTVPQVQVPQVPPSLQSTVPLPNVQTPTVPQVPTVPPVSIPPLG